ncbi:DUF305 domain-containing protein [Sphingomonas sp. ABOLH]|jgi:uncharacterized protein (DUF305 family)|nr:MAG: DUF305 domain-containing protein [Sphingomonas sp.]RSV32716.1 DUF305 domain-containing protein [Sphingomonas sp. ABOLH]
MVDERGNWRVRVKKAVLSAIALAAIAGGTAVAQQSGHAGHRQPGGMTMQATPANPYPPAEMRMHEKMMAAVGADATETWVRKMIEHHRGGIEMSRIVLRETRDARVRQMATKTIADQTREVGQLNAWLRARGKRTQ